MNKREKSKTERERERDGERNKAAGFHSSS